MEPSSNETPKAVRHWSWDEAVRADELRQIKREAMVGANIAPKRQPWRVRLAALKYCLADLMPRRRRRPFESI